MTAAAYAGPSWKATVTLGRTGCLLVLASQQVRRSNSRAERVIAAVERAACSRVVLIAIEKLLRAA